MKKQKRPPEWFIPLNPPRYNILSSLTAAPKHGYAIIKDIREVTGGAIALGVPTLYENIVRLLDDGLIERDGERPVAGGERRKTYRITGLGEGALAADERARAPLSARNVAAAPDGAWA